ncbi:MAG TPA: VIT domain-containing protein [Chloroflexota bacterium]
MRTLAVNRVTSWTVLGVLMLLVGTSEALAIGRVYARLPNNATSPIYNLRIKSLRADGTIRDQLAVTHVDQTFANDNNLRLEGFYIFKLPEGAQVHELYLWINGVRTTFAVKRLQDAIVKYTDIVRRIQDPAILQSLGSNVFKLQIFPFDPLGTRRVEIVYSQPLTYYSGSIQYVFPLDMTDYTSAPIEDVGISIAMRSELPITGVTTSSDAIPQAVKVTKIDDHQYTVEYGVENVTFSRDFLVRANIDRTGRSLVGLTYNPAAPGEDPYFIVWSSVPDSLYSDSVLARDLTFVADVSSSMEGDRLEQLKDALLSFIDLLTERDRFNIIAFGTSTVKFKPDLVGVTEATRDSARKFVGGLVALGLTNFEAALHDALTLGYNEGSHSAVVLLTDGQPTWGVTRTDSLLAMAARWNTYTTPIFPVGVGQELDFTLLQQLAARNGGIFTPVAASDSVYLTVKELYRRLFLQKLRNIAMDYGTISAIDVHPMPLPDVFAGDQLLTTGRFTAFGKATVTMSGMAGGTPFSTQAQLTFPDTERTTFAVARYWGARKIGSLLTLISQMGEKQELVDQVIALSIKYSVLTPYTAFLVVEPTQSSGTAVEEPGAKVPLTTELVGNFPNPFNPSTTITFSLGHEGAPQVTIRIYDMLGRLVRTLVQDQLAPGVHQVSWDATDDAGHRVASGMYIVRMTAGRFVASKTIMLLK